MADDKDGDTKRYDLGAIKVSPNGLSPYDYIINEMNAGIEDIKKVRITARNGMKLLQQEDLRQEHMERYLKEQTQ